MLENEHWKSNPERSNPSVLLQSGARHRPITRMTKARTPPTPDGNIDTNRKPSQDEYVYSKVSEPRQLRRDPTQI